MSRLWTRRRLRQALLWLGVCAALGGLLFYRFRWLPERSGREEARKHRLAAAGSLKVGDVYGVESELIQAITAWPGDAGAYSMLGDLYQGHGEPELAAVAYLRLRDMAPQHPHIYCRLAQAAADEGADESARRYAAEEIKKDSRCVSALLLLAAEERRTSEKQAARRHAEQAYNAAPKDVRTVITYAENLLSDDPDQAASLLEKAQKDLPTAWEVAYDLGYCYAHGAGAAAAWPQALRQLRQAQTLNPRAGVVYRELCLLLRKMGQPQEAARAGALAVQYNPLDRLSYVYYAQSLTAAGRPAEAEAVTARYQAIDTVQRRRRAILKQYGKFPDDPRTARELAGLNVQLGRIGEAVQGLEEALAAHPGDEQLRRELARLMQPPASR